MILFILTVIIVLLIAIRTSPLLYYIFLGKTVTIKGRGYQLKGRIYGNPDRDSPCSAVLFLAGWNPGKLPWSTSDFYAGYFAKKYNTVCLTIAFRGMGSNGDIKTLKRSDFLDDAVAAYDYLSLTNGIDRKKISVAGESFGSYMACLLSSRKSVEKMALRVPMDFPDNGFDSIPQIQPAGNLTKEWESLEHVYSESLALNSVHDYKGKIMLVSSDKDRIVPFRTIENYLTAAADGKKIDYRLMKNTGHGLINPVKMYEYVKLMSEGLADAI